MSKRTSNQHLRTLTTRIEFDYLCYCEGTPINFFSVKVRFKYRENSQYCFILSNNYSPMVESGSKCMSILRRYVMHFSQKPISKKSYLLLILWYTFHLLASGPPRRREINKKFLP